MKLPFIGLALLALGIFIGYGVANHYDETPIAGPAGPPKILLNQDRKLNVLQSQVNVFKDRVSALTQKSETLAGQLSVAQTSYHAAKLRETKLASSLDSFLNSGQMPNDSLTASLLASVRTQDEALSVARIDKDSLCEASQRILSDQVAVQDSTISDLSAASKLQSLAFATVQDQNDVLRTQAEFSKRSARKLRRKNRVLAVAAVALAAIATFQTAR